MKHRVEILPSAWEYLKRIEDYYILQFDVQAALKVSDHILDTTFAPDEDILNISKRLTRQNKEAYEIDACQTSESPSEPGRYSKIIVRGSKGGVQT